MYTYNQLCMTSHTQLPVTMLVSAVVNMFTFDVASPCHRPFLT